MARKKKQGERGYEKQEVREAFMKSYRGKHCEVCNTTYRTCAHHLLPQSKCVFHCVSPENIVVLCQKHHRMGNDIAGHSESILVTDKFATWMKENKPEQWAWIKAHQRDTGKVNWKEMYEEIAKKQGSFSK